MKEVIFFVTLITLVSCIYRESEVEVSPNTDIDSSLESYLTSFEEEAAQRGYHINIEDLDLVSHIAPIDQNNVAGTCHYSSQYPNRITIDEDFWNSASHLMREMVVFHELGHCVLSRGHSEATYQNGQCVSIMQSGLGSCRLNYTNATRSQYLDELFTNF